MTRAKLLALAERDGFRAALLDRIKRENGCATVECTDPQSECCECWALAHGEAGITDA